MAGLTEVTEQMSPNGQGEAIIWSRRFHLILGFRLMLYYVMQCVLRLKLVMIYKHFKNCSGRASTQKPRLRRE